MQMHARVLIFAATALFAGPALAAFHLWEIVEVYSNQDGSVQFVELEGQSNFQHELEGHTMAATSDGEQKSITFPNDLPSTSTNGRRMLLATPGFADLPGGIAPDYEIPPRFFDPDAGTIHLNFAETSDIFSFSCSDLPTDGVLALLVGDPLSTATNSPENFSGAAGELQPGIVFLDRFEVSCVEN